MEREHFEKYIKDVTSHVRFRFDRRGIAEELREHMEDLYEDLLSQGIEAEQAEELALEWMGDSEEVGKALDAEHNPVLGWIWLFCRRALILIFLFFGIPALFGVSCTALMTGYDAVDTFFTELYAENDVVYTVDVDQKVKIDDTVFSVKNLKYHEDGTMEIRYLSYRSPFWRGMYNSRFSLYDCEINNGAEYVKEVDDWTEDTYHVQGLYWDISAYLEDFPEDSQWLNIIYENGERSFTMEIPLTQKEGEE
ncbi:hypothetical protein H9X85_11120 [Anaerotignum lactatifermentans]|uniref:DUF4179 domain-containing protein n=1 Tax=Anaerotignum lactatifermentans TaxID=160404 RepID=A0ABS2GB53_9FIRM|nr:permease prefix domain 1-containing protein [Anaerotignum lactatifermentans]MBM6830134.1 hypothetical protein [Anaerotignum lactatifermentans]MBM6878721.1 hypothetical protein [Anaerotignum lactatifermentans]MBM6951748.1 hypothetical protein [Anaerotignum lactatifermentans]